MEPSLTLRPIGHIRSHQQAKFDARHQPLEEAGADETHLLELLPGCDYETALQDLAGFERIWLLWWFHKNARWRPLVLPPRGPAQRRGVFATRSPHRPNPLGLTPVRLLGIEGLRLTLGPCDLLDGTPVLDIKPYFPAYDAFPEARGGWIEDVEAAVSGPPAYTVDFDPHATVQADWLAAEWRIDFRARLVELLSRDPSPHRTRRIKKRRGGEFEIGCGSWHALFRVEGTRVTIIAIEAAYPMRFLLESWRQDVPDREAQLAYVARWPRIE